MANPNGTNQQSKSGIMSEAATREIAEVLQSLGTTQPGLSSDEAAASLVQHGPNEVAQEKKHTWLWRLWIAALNPLVILLSILAIITFATADGTSDYIGGGVMVAMVVLGLSLRFVQETKA